ncbi:MAG: NAD(P)/FAD-dependent oxidoreductase [Sumerlaeia bacterium]
MSNSENHPKADIVIIGAGAAGLTAAIFAGQQNLERQLGLRIVLLDGARKPGAKILVSGGGRCNVTNQKVTAADFCGGSPTIIRNVLRRFDEKKTVEWMSKMGVELKPEPRGKLFPTTNTARTVLEALLREMERVNVELRADHRVLEVCPQDEGFLVELKNREPLLATRLILATGGLSLPKSGSDGWGVALAKRLGHQIVPTTPSLVPLVTDSTHEVGHALQQFTGLAANLSLDLVLPSGKRLYSREESLLFTHFGLSGPAALDFSRHFLRFQLEHPNEEVRACLRLPMFAHEDAAQNWIRQNTEANTTASIEKLLGSNIPKQLAQYLVQGAPNWPEFSKQKRGEFARRLACFPLPITGPRGYSFAETTAGGVALDEIHYRTMESKRVNNLSFCGELLDVDGRIGGFNFQWAWASGFVAGTQAVASFSRSLNLA